MTVVEPELEGARPPIGAGFTDSVTYAFGDPATGLYGLARLGLSPVDGVRLGSALGVLFSGRETLGVIAEGGVTLAADAGWDELELNDLMSTTVDRPLESWRVSMTAGEGVGFELAFDAISIPASFESGGMEGYEQLCRVSGTADGRRIECMGQRGHSWGSPDWSEITLARSLGAWFEDDTAVALTAIRPAGTEDHDGEQVWAAMLDAEGSVAIADPRLSTTYDDEGHQRRAGLELWVGEDDEYPHRGSGQVLCGSSLELGQLRLECAFFAWHLDGRDGVGRYDVLRRS
jgi:hypothetical protein